MTCTLSRRDFVKSVGAGAASLAMSSNRLRAESTADGAKPNILLILVDDLGPEWLSCYGGQEMKTPNLDRLAAGGMQFNNAYSMAQCTPSRATLLTGQYPFRHGWVNHWDVPRWGAGCHFDWRHHLTFARVLKEAGYATAAAGKWQINDFRVQPDAMARHGFDEWCMWTGFETNNPPSAERYWNPYLNTKSGSKTYQGKFGTDVFVEFLIDFMRRRKDSPMMLYFPMCLTHAPFTDTPLDRGAKGKIARQKAMVRYTDHAVGRLVTALEELKIREKTIVIFTTDNGSTRGITARMNGREVPGGKASLGENGVREPFIVNGPGLVPAGVKTDALTDFTDLFPTFFELAGAKVPGGAKIDGHSIAKLIRGQAKDSPREWIMSMGFGPARLTEQGVEPKVPFADRVVRDKRFKLWVSGGKPAKLYDLIDDPAETKNLIRDGSPRVVAARKRLEAVVASFPKRDARPEYEPTPSQPWDRKPEPPRKRVRGKDRTPK
ncbi:MAG: sulfatase-like hydrolase/transferase [Phycisphaerae bacterium]|nr:sulfatase-like hydrolase/transferase [Phycisphaerae bacterium]